MSATLSNSINTPPPINLNLHTCIDHGPVIEQINGLIKLYKDGYVQRPPAMPEVPSTSSPEPGVTSRDVIIDHTTGVWARVYVPRRQSQQQHLLSLQLLPLLLYFHGGGFCVGSAAWRCCHEFLAKLSSQANCIVVSVNYRLAPEHRLPAAYEDGLSAVQWLRQQASYNGSNSDDSSWWRSNCNFDRIYIAGDSSGANMAYNVSTQLGSVLKGLILIQPFFGGEARTESELNSVQPRGSALTLATSDCYWRLALPPGANRDHPWCNPLARGWPDLEGLPLPPAMVCVSEMDILKDRELEVCDAMRRAGKIVEHKMYEGVGHGFQVLHNYNLSQVRTQEMLTDIKAFLNNYR